MKTLCKLQNTQINFTKSEIYIGLVEHAMILGTASENKYCINVFLNTQ